MDTYIHISSEPDSRMVTNGKTGNKKIDEIIPKLYEKFSVFELVITEKYKFDTGFLIKLHSHDSNQNEIWGDIYIEYQYYNYKGGPGHHYTIHCGKPQYLYPGELSDDLQAYESTGSKFDKVLDDFFKGSIKVMTNKIKRIEKYQQFVENKVDNVGTKNSSFHEILYA
jgi:hypothetical protein